MLKKLKPSSIFHHIKKVLYWAHALAAQEEDTELKATFTPMAEALTTNPKKQSLNALYDQVLR
jgi:monomeric isocitrate dehydrogenase